MQETKSKTALVNCLEDLSELQGKKSIRVEVDGRIREMAYHHSTLTREGTKRIFYSRSGNSDYVSQFIIGDEQIQFIGGQLKFERPYDKTLCNRKKGGLAFYGIDKILAYTGL